MAVNSVEITDEYEDTLTIEIYDNGHAYIAIEPKGGGLRAVYLEGGQRLEALRALRLFSGE